MAALSTIVAISAIASSVFSVEQSLTAKTPKAPALPTPPAAPPTQDSAAIEAALSRRKAKASIAGQNTSTLLTPIGAGDARASIDRKTLLGL